MNILVTGGTGYIGSHTCVELLNAGYDLVAIKCILTGLYAADSEWRVHLLRYFNPIGAHPSGLIREAPNGIGNQASGLRKPQGPAQFGRDPAVETGHPYRSLARTSGKLLCDATLPYR